MSEWGCVESFGIDHGELDGLTLQEAFVLGYELAEICAIAENNPAIVQRPIHANNLARIRAACEKRGRRIVALWMNGDVSESWMDLTILAR